MSDGVDRARAERIPVIDVDYTQQRDAGWAYAHLDGLREESAFTYNEANTATGW